MFYFNPFSFGKIIWIYIAAAVIPAIFLMRYIYKQDRVEREPPRLLASLTLYGVIAAVCAGVLEKIGMVILQNTVRQSDPYYTVLLAFLVVAAVEEGAKLFFLHYRTWRDGNFSHLFDGVVYAAFVSLGFAAYENIQYVFSYGLSVAASRALFAVPGHLGFSVFMGVFYGRAKLWDNRGSKSGKTVNLLLGYGSAVLLHGFYDACALSNTPIAQILFYAFVAVMYVVVICLIRYASRRDRPVW